MRNLTIICLCLLFSALVSAKTHHMNVDYSCYEGKTVRGVTKTVLSRGRVVIEEGKYVGKKGDGQFLKRGEAFSPRK